MIECSDRVKGMEGGDQSPEGWDLTKTPYAVSFIFIIAAVNK